MTLALQGLLFVGALCLVAYVFRSVKKAKMRIEDALAWVLLAALILILSIFPRIAYWCADALGFQAPVNFICLFFIFILLIKGFTTSRHVSQLENKVKELSQQIAVDQLDHYERKDAQQKH